MTIMLTSCNMTFFPTFFYHSNSKKYSEINSTKSQAKLYTFIGFQWCNFIVQEVFFIFSVAVVSMNIRESFLYFDLTFASAHQHRVKTIAKLEDSIRTVIRFSRLTLCQEKT